jgi:hypothetical protein
MRDDEFWGNLVLCGLILCVLCTAIHQSAANNKVTADGCTVDHRHQALVFAGPFSQTKVLVKNGRVVEVEEAWARAPICMTRAASPENVLLWHKYFDVLAGSRFAGSGPPLILENIIAGICLFF